jgi:hypothetical protein
VIFFRGAFDIDEGRIQALNSQPRERTEVQEASTLTKLSAGLTLPAWLVSALLALHLSVAVATTWRRA